MATIYEHVTNQIVQSLEAGVVPWIKPWSNDGKAQSPWGLPYNAAKGREYRGANIPLLWAASSRGEFGNDGWLTLKQANALGGRILKGERSTYVHFWHWREDAERGKRIPSLRPYRVFNVAQCEGLELPERTPGRDLGAGAIENRVRELGARVKLGGNSAYFDGNHDRIAVPLPERFKTSDNFYSTLLHELTHWTGHAPRLGRDLTGQFGTTSYAREELVAELGSAFLCARFGIALEGLQHPAYLASWLKVLKADSRAIMQAASAAQKATDFVLGEGYQPEGDDQPLPEAEPAEVVAVPVILPEPEPVQPEPVADADTQALAASYICNVAVALYWAGHANALDREMAERVAVVKARTKRTRKPKVAYDKVGRVTGRADAASMNWQVHPVTGYRVNVPAGKDIRDLIPYGREPEALATVAKHYQTHARIGAANVLTMLERAGEDASQYRYGLMSRRREAGMHRYSYGPGKIDYSQVLDCQHGSRVKPAGVDAGAVA